ncbi:MAG TPA: glycosyltransferase [Candidatus Saccharimonadales bacterium]|nr:glycosyltransferase [Candidatus Saccharimonadales bacterium]
MTLALVAIVKDAAASIEACLAAARPHISAATIVDTGSTDGTPDLICSLMPEAQVYRRPWVNFGRNRSEALKLAQGTADWLLALDADMTVDIDAGFAPDPAYDAYMIEMRDNGTAWRLPLLLRGDLPWESRGAVHEYTCLPDRAYRSRPTDEVRVHFPTTPTSPAKRRWHADMLEEELKREPDNPRTVFYLAQTYREMDDPAWARRLYLRRADMGGFEEEAWYAAFRAALLARWPAQATELMAAWERRPHRLEPLYCLLKELNARGLHRAAYRLSKVPFTPPEGDVLFIEHGVWDWGIEFERSLAAWWVGERREFASLTDSLLRRRVPETIREALLRNQALPSQPDPIGVH